jgi:hypothetical protein
MNVLVFIKTLYKYILWLIQTKSELLFLTNFNLPTFACEHKFDLSPAQELCVPMCYLFLHVLKSSPLLNT